MDQALKALKKLNVFVQKARSEGLRGSVSRYRIASSECHQDVMKASLPELLASSDDPSREASAS
jgi:hypothetical protein